MGTQGTLQASSLDRRFFAHLGASRLERDICGSTAASGSRAVLGTATAVLPEQLSKCRLILLWGTNTLVTNRHLWPFIQEARKNRGCKLVVIDPVRTATARHADLHLRIRPGADAVLALALARSLADHDLLDKEYLADHTSGAERLLSLAALVERESFEQRTGISLDQLDTLTNWYGSLRPACIRPLVGMERSRYGAETFELLASLPALVGAWRDVGGGLAHLANEAFQQCLNLDGVVGQEPEAPNSPRSINMVQLGRALTESLAPPVRALVVYNSNPADSAPNQALVRKGLAREDLLVVVSEQFPTDTTQFADYLLPATTQLEHWDLMWSWGHSYLALNQPAMAPHGEAISNTELFRRLAARMELVDELFSLSDIELIRVALDGPRIREAGITLAGLKSTGWAPLPMEEEAPFAAGGFPTPDGRCHLAPHVDARLVRILLKPDKSGGLTLLSPKSKKLLNTSYGDTATGVEGAPVAQLNIQDAQKLGVSDGDLVRVYNERGELVVRAEVGDTAPPGVLCLPSGAWGSRSADGKSVNTLTSDGLSCRGGGGDFFDTRVHIDRTADAKLNRPRPPRSD